MVPVNEHCQHATKSWERGFSPRIDDEKGEPGETAAKCSFATNSLSLLFSHSSRCARARMDAWGTSSTQTIRCDYVEA